jgi:flagellar M-ring protein FliF
MDMKREFDYRALLTHPNVRQLFFMLSIVFSVAMGITLFMSIQEPTYRPLDYQINAQTMPSIINTLEKANIPYKLDERNNLILVKGKDAGLASLKLAAMGIAKEDGFNYDFLNDKNNFGNSQFLENARYLRALENDLAKSIGSLSGIANARVHIAMPQGNIFADDVRKTTASIIINIEPSMMSDKEKVRAIMQLVAASVPGLDPKDVALTDQYGHNLSGGLGEDSFVSAEQLGYQRNLQSYYEKRIESLIMPLLGDEKVNVRVNADIDFTQQEEANEQYDPDKSVIRSEQTTIDQSEAGGGASGAPGALSNTPPSSDAEKAGAGGDSGNSHSRNQNVKNYEVTKVVHYQKTSFPKVKGLSVAVVVDDEKVFDEKTKLMVSKPVSADKMQKINDLVKAAIGFNTDRGDKVTVVNSSFSVMDLSHEPKSHVWDQLWFWDVIKRIVGIIIGGVFLIMVYRQMSQRRSRGSKMSSSGSSFSMDHTPEPDGNAIAQQMRLNSLKQMAASNPDKVASIIKNWVGKSDE